MKKFYLLAMTAFLCAGSFAQTNIELVSEVDGNIRITCGVSDWSYHSVDTPQGSAWIVTSQDGSPILRAGAPDVQRLTVPVVVHDHNKMAVSIIESEYIEIPDVEIAPSKGNLIRTIDPSVVAYNYGEVYNANEFYPGKLADLDNAFIQGVVRGQSLHFYPLQYNPVTKVLRVYSQILVDVKVTEEPGENAFTSSNNRVNAVMHDAYSHRYINYNTARYDVVGELGNLLVITDAEYLEELEPWVQWKREKGIPTEVVTISEIGNTVAAINTFVENYYDNNGLTYLVIVGDEDQVPTLLVNNGGGQGYCDACYGYIDGNDSYAEIHVGRLIVHNENELPPVIEKILEYEKAPYIASDWFSVAMGIGSDEGAGFGDDNEADWEHQNEMKEDLINFTYTEVWEKYDGNHNASSPTGGVTADASGSPSAASLTTVIEDGCSLINYTGHGSHTSIVTGSYTNTQINALTNQHLFPYFIIVGCCTGDFDDDDAGGDTFGEAWLKTMDGTEPAGGIGGSFSSVYQSWAPPMEGQDEMNHIIAAMTDYETRHTIGSIHTNGCASMNDVYNADGDEMTDTWHIFGDPTVQLRTAYPTNIEVDHNPTVFFGTTEISIDCNVEDAVVCLSWNGEILGWGIVAGGSVDIVVPTLSEPGLILVTATSFNTIPSQTTIEVMPAEGPYVVDESEVLDDANGNANGVADYAESLLLDISLENVGIEVATAVEATLSTNDVLITITDNYQYFGDINPGEIPFMDDAFAFDVADGVEDQHEVEFMMTITDYMGNTWEMDFNVTLNAPVLICPADFIIDDSDGNNDGRIDSGETVTISVAVINDGHSDSTPAMATLTTTSSYLTIEENTVDAGVIEDGTSQNAIFTVVADASIPDGSTAEFMFDAVAGMYATSSCNYEALLDAIIEDWETNGTNQFDWQLSGSANWFTTTQNPYEGNYCLESGNINNSEETILILELEILEAGDLSFSYRVSTEEGWDKLTFKRNGTILGTWSGETDWTEVSYPMTVGTHTLRWMYKKDDIVSQGEDACWVDDIIFPPSATVVSVDVITTSTNHTTIYPNPTSTNATLEFMLDNTSEVNVVVEDALGQVVSTMKKGTMNSGEHRIVLDVQSYPAGVYFINIQKGDEVERLKMVKN
ncbi:MAG: C25 family cysteine peptidase [Flavobacteriales bacterium]|nr:C25 family cysteine peptidase [Flavobacteriales bacterium]